MAENEDEKIVIPEKFRASLDESDEVAFARLQANDAAQEEIKAKVNAPFIAHTPKERERVNAGILISTLEPLQNLDESQRELLAEAYAGVGDYELAAETTNDVEKSAVYFRYREAIWRDEGEWCEHPKTHQFVKDNVWSLKAASDVALLCCNVCQFMNAAPVPEALRQKQSARANVRQMARPKNFVITQALAWHKSNVKP